MTMLNEVNPNLEHHGIKGMHWGVRAAKTVSGGGFAQGKKFTSEKPPTAQQIKTARVNVRSQSKAVSKQNYKRLRSVGKNWTEQNKKFHTQKASFLKNPDRATALRMTKGEKRWATAAGLLVPGVGTVSVATKVGSNVLIRKSIENYQDNI